METHVKPNVVFLMVDQLSAKWLEAAESRICDLPNIGRLKGMGATFTNAFSNNPVCCPARASIATGLTSRGHGLISNGYRLNPSIPTFMQTLQTAGWRTGAFGKVHFYPFDSEMYPYPDYSEYGWEVNHNTEDNRTGEWLDWIEGEHPDHYEAVLATMHNWAAALPYYAAYGERKINLIEKMRRSKEQMSWPDGADAGLQAKTEGFYPLPFPEEISQTNWITDRAIDFIDETPAERPIYAHISYVQPHSPFHAPERYMESVNEALIPAPVGYKTAHWKTPEKVPNWDYMRKLYFADLVHIDRQIGRIIDRLAQIGRLDNTFIFFTSDHGEMLMDHGLMAKSANHYDACIRIPLIIAGPGMKRGTVCDLPVQHEDICPTVLDVYDSLLDHHPRPLIRPWLKEEPPLFSGRSLMPLCKGEQVSDWRESVYVESFGALCESPFNEQIMKYPWKKTLRNSEFRYSVTPGRDGGEKLFDLKKDPQELVNVVDDPDYQEARRQLMREMLHRVMLQDYPIPPRDLCVIAAH